jgi:hypothetical protein
MTKKRRIVFKKTNTHSINYTYEYTNQIFENDKWKFANRYIGKFGSRPIIWYESLEWAEQYAPQDYEIDNMVEWDGIDEEGYKNICNYK